MSLPCMIFGILVTHKTQGYTGLKHLKCRTPDKGEVSGSNPDRPTSLQNHYNHSVYLFLYINLSQFF